MQKGDEVLVKTNFGWIPGRYYDECNIGHRIEIEKVQKGTRRYLPKGASTIWPYSYRFAVIVKDLRELKKPAQHCVQSDKGRAVSLPGFDTTPEG